MNAIIPEFDARRAFPLQDYFPLPASGTPVGLGFACLLYSVLCVTPGTVTGVYDNPDGVADSASINLVPTPVAMTAGQSLVFAAGEGIRMPSGIYVAVTGGTYMILAISEL
jgi:hypothetical protein